MDRLSITYILNKIGKHGKMLYKVPLRNFVEINVRYVYELLLITTFILFFFIITNHSFFLLYYFK